MHLHSPGGYTKEARLIELFIWLWQGAEQEPIQWRASRLLGCPRQKHVVPHTVSGRCEVLLFAATAMSICFLLLSSVHLFFFSQVSIWFTSLECPSPVVVPLQMGMLQRVCCNIKVHQGTRKHSVASATNRQCQCQCALS
jgi:hypothetical protein